MAAHSSSGGFATAPSSSSSSQYNPYGSSANHAQHRSGSTASAGGSHSRRVTSQSSIASSSYTASTGRGSVVGSGSSSAAAHMESTVTKLLVATKQLLEGLTDWSQNKISEEQVSDIYVRLGNCFNACVSAFSKEGISMKDLKEIPSMLRARLEAAINEEASPATLNEHLPKIRPIILDLLRGLREKQDQHQAMVAHAAERERERERTNRSDSMSYPGSQEQPNGSVIPRQSSISGPSSGAQRTRQPSLGQSKSREDMYAGSNGRASPAPGSTSTSRPSSRTANHPQSHSDDMLLHSGYQAQQDGHPARRPSHDGSSGSMGRRISNTARPGSIVKSRSSSSLRPTRTGSGDSASTPTLVEAPLPPLPPHLNNTPRPPLPLPGQQHLHPPDNASTATPPLPRISTPSQADASERASTPSPTFNKPSAFHTPPRSTLRPIAPNHAQAPPLPPMPDAGPGDPSLEALKKADPLSRRASKRFSQYTFNKMSASQSMISSPSSSLASTLPSRSMGMERDDSAREFINNSTGRPSMSSSKHSDSGQSSASTSSSGHRKPRKNKSSTSPRSAEGDLLEPVPALPAFPDALPKLSFSPDGTWGLGLTPGTSVASTLPTGKGKKRVSVVTEETEDQLGDSDANSGSAMETEEEEDVTVRHTPPNGEVSPKSRPQDLEKLRPPNSFMRKDSAASIASSVSKYSTEDNGDIAENTPTMPSLPVIVETVPTAPISPTLPISPSAVPSTIYLQLGRDMKKAKLDPNEPITFAGLRMLFTDKFAYNPGLADFPAIYLRHPSSGVQYELEDLEEIKEHSVLSLNIEPLDQVKQHIDEGLASLARDLKELKTAMNSSKRASVALSAVQPALLAPTTPVLSPSERKVPTEMQVQAAAQKVFDLKRKASSSGKPAERDTGKETAVSSPTTSVSSNAENREARVARLAGDLRSSFNEIQTVRREVGALKQIYVDFKNETSTIIGSLRTQTEQVKELANSQVPGSRAFIDSGKAKLDSKSQDLLTKIEELQDNIDDLKNDVTSRRIKPKTKQMDAIKASMQSRAAELEELTQYISSVKPMWKKTWEAELQNIVEEQQLLNHQEELLADLKADHENVVTIFEQIQQYVSLRMASSGRRQEYRPPSPTRGHEGLKTVLLEVKGLAPASESRMKAIEQAEKARRKEVDEKTDEFASELSGFVEGKLLKKTGGAEETERIRQLKSEASLRAMFNQSPAAVPPNPGAAPPQPATSEPSGPSAKDISVPTEGPPKADESQTSGSAVDAEAASAADA